MRKHFYSVAEFSAYFNSSDALRSFAVISINRSVLSNSLSAMNMYGMIFKIYVRIFQTKKLPYPHTAVEGDIAIDLNR